MKEKKYNTVNPSLCPSGTCPIMCSFDTLQQFPGGPLLLTLLIFYEPPWRLWLRDLSNPIVTLSNPNLELDFSFLFRIAFRCTFRIELLGILGH